jgi:hypothetical protein
MTTIEKAQASYLGPSEPTPGRQPTRSLGVVVVVVDGGNSLLGSAIWSNQTGMGKSGSKATVSTHPKYSARLTSDLFYVCNIFKGRLYLWTGLQKY